MVCHIFIEINRKKIRIVAQTMHQNPSANNRRQPSAQKNNPPVFLFSPIVRHYWEGPWHGPFVEPWRRLYDCELVYVSQGEAELHLGAERHPLKANMLVIIPPRLRHETLVDPGRKTMRHCVHFDWVPTLPELEQRPLMAFEHERFESLGQTVIPPPQIAAHLPLVVSLDALNSGVKPALKTALTLLRAGRYEEAGGWLWPVLNAALRHVASQADGSAAQQAGGLSLHAVQAAKDHMDRNYTIPVTLDQLASLTRISANYLCMVFRRVVGKSPIQYLNDLRVQHACRLLESGHLNIEEVALHVGIPDANYFARLFKQKTGFQPRDYARNQSKTT